MTTYTVELAFDIQESMPEALTEKKIYRGDTPTFEFTFTDGDPAVFYDLTGATVTFAIKRSLTSTTEVPRFSKTCVLDVDPTTGKCTSELLTTDSDHSGSYTAELQAEFAGGLIRTLCRFTLSFVNDLVI